MLWQNSEMALRFDAARVLERMAGGEHAAHIARDFGVSKQAISKRLRRPGTRRDYREAMQRGAKVRLLRALRQIRDNDIPVKALSLEILYCERRASRVLVEHEGLIREAWRCVRARIFRRRITWRATPSQEQ